MAQPIEYSTFGKMMIDHAPFIVIGAVSIIGLTMLILRKAGLLILNKEKPNHEACKHCDLANNNNKIVKCESHEALCSTVDKMDARQKLMKQQQDSHTSALKNGKQEFKDIKDHIANLRVGVAVLLERSGGAPKEFTEVK